MRPPDFQQFVTDEGYIRAPNFTKVRKALQKGAKRGKPAAQRSLATLYLFGYGVPQNLLEAAKWFEKAANQGDAFTRFSLGDMYRIGQGAPQDNNIAAKWFRKAAEQGDAGAAEIKAAQSGSFHYLRPRGRGTGVGAPGEIVCNRSEGKLLGAEIAIQYTAAYLNLS